MLFTQMEHLETTRQWVNNIELPKEINCSTMSLNISTINILLDLLELPPDSKLTTICYWYNNDHPDKKEVKYIVFTFPDKYEKSYMPNAEQVFDETSQNIWAHQLRVWLTERIQNSLDNGSITIKNVCSH